MMLLPSIRKVFIVNKLDCPEKDRAIVPKAPENSFSKILPDEISKYEFSMPFEIDMTMVQSSSIGASIKSAKK